MRFFELFSKPVTWHWDVQSKDSWIAIFYINNIEYQVFFSYDDYSQDYPVWNVEFAAYGEKVQDPYSITGTGYSSYVFGTVIDIVKQFKSTHKEFLTFTAEEPSRKKLYTALVKKLSQGYTIDQFSNGSNLTFTVK